MVRLGLCKDQTLRYESKLKAGDFFVSIKENTETIDKAKKLPGENKVEPMDVVESA